MKLLYRVCPVCRGWGRELARVVVETGPSGKIETSAIQATGGRFCGNCMGAGFLPERRKDKKRVEKERRKN